jgi:predicted phosphodiesterase
MASATRTVAILADVHGNLPALEAVLADVAARGIREVVVAGDLVGFGADPNAVVDRLVARGATLVLGNHEAEYVGGYADPATRTAWRADPDLTSMCWYLDRLGTARAALLTALPDRHWLDPATLVTHGSPRHVRDSVRAETPEDELAAMFAPAPPRLAFVGHTHLPLIRDEPWGRVVNVGSVGAPLGDPRATYAVATRAPGAPDGDWAVALARVPYDVAAAIAAYAGGMGDADPAFAALLGRQLRTGRPVFRSWLRLRATLAPADWPAALARFLAGEP